MLVMIACNRPGYIRGGVRHPEFATYFAGYFTAAQLHEMIGDRHLTVCVGHPLTAANVDEFLTRNNPPESECGTGAAAAEGNAAAADEIPGADAGQDGRPENDAAMAPAATTASADGKPRASASRRRK